MEHFLAFFPAIFAGFGLFLAGAANLLLVRRGIAIRAIATVVALGCPVAAAAALDQRGVMAATIRLLAYGMIPFLLLGSHSLASRVATLITAAHRPVARFGLLTAAGVGIIISSIVAYERADVAATDANQAELDLLSARSNSIPTEQIKTATDQGTQIVLKEPLATREATDLCSAESRVLQLTHLNDHVMRRSSADDRSNCHGWVFTGGRFLLGGDSIEIILKENGYQENAEPHAGDLVVYRNNGAISHTGIVRYVSEGQPILVESKWGELGVFLHQPDKSPYGSEFVFYRSPRRGHLLTGIGGQTAKPGDSNEPVPTIAPVE